MILAENGHVPDQDDPVLEVKVGGLVDNGGSMLKICLKVDNITILS